MGLRGSLDGDTADLLRDVRANARESFYHPSAVRMAAVALLVVLSLVISILGLFVDDPLRLVFVCGGVFGMVTAAIWFAWRPAL